MEAKRKMKRLVVLLGVFVIVAAFVSAQEFGDIKGTVKDAEGIPLPGVSVTLAGSKIAAMTGVTSEKGNFRFLNLPVADDYSLKFELEGFQTLIREKLALAFGRDMYLEISLEQSQISEEVIVTGQAPVIDTKRAQVGVNVGEEMIMGLPTARNPWVIMSLIPGVLIDREDIGGNEAGQQSSYYGHGSSEDDNTWNIDGANITDNSALGAAPAYVNISSYEEVQINYGNNDIQSQTGGVQINLVSKRGGNDYSGTFYLDVERNAWQSDNVPDDLKDLGYTAAGINRLYLYGANFGGPLIKDKAWFYLSWGIQDIDALALTGDSDKTWLSSGYGRLDFQITSTTRMNLFVEYDNKSKWGRPWYGFAQQASDTLWNQTGPSYFWKGEVEQFIGDLYLSAKASFMGGPFSLTPVQGERTPDGSGNYLTRLYYPSFYMEGNTDTYGTDRDQINFNASAIYYVEDVLGADHEFKFGVDYVKATTTTYDYYEGNLALAYFGPDPTLPLGEWWEAWLVRDYEVNYLFKRYSAFLQDTISVGRIAVNLGIRYDWEKSWVNNVDIPASPWLPQYMPAIQVEQLDPGINWSTFSPRLSVSYDLFGTGKDIVKLSLARYGSQSGNNLADWVNPLGWSEVDVIWQDYNADGRVTVEELFGYDWGTGELKDVNDPAYWLWQSNAVNPEDPTSVVSLNKYDSKYNSPLLDELSLSYEKEIFADFATRVELFFKKRHNHTWRRPMLADGTLETEANYTVVEQDPVTGYNIYERDKLYPYEYITNHEKMFDRYLGAQFVFTKRLSNRWMLNGSFTYADWRRYYKGEYLAVIDDVWYDEKTVGLNNEEYFEGGVVAPESGGSGVQEIFVNSRWQFKVSGLYQLPYGINFSGVFSAREGYIKPTNVLVQMPGIGSEELYGNPDGGGKFGDQRLPAFWVLNFRLEKVFQITDSSTVTLSADAFNITNSSHALKKELRITADDFDQDLRILNPRVFRFGVRFNF
jgi:hypothetical protein